jgi:pimeloyl-ACP methyl ester carboxylesterase
MQDKDAERIRTFKDIPDHLVASVKVPTLIVLGDTDIVKAQHVIELTRPMPDARLLILPGGHGDYPGELVMTQEEMRYPELTAGVIEEFIRAP